MFLILFVVIAGPVFVQFGAEGPTPEVTSVVEGGAVQPGMTARVVIKVDLGEGWHVNAHDVLDDYLVPTGLAVKLPKGITIHKATTYPKPTQITLAGTTESINVYDRFFEMVFVVKVAEDMAPASYMLEGLLTYQACDDKQCMPPASLDISIPITVGKEGESKSGKNRGKRDSHLFSSQENTEGEDTPRKIGDSPYFPDDSTVGFTVAGTASGFLSASDFLAFLDLAETGGGGTEKNPLAERGLWFVIVFIVGGGLLLNLTPCVLPLIPINLAIIGAGAKAGSKSRGFLLGATYGAGIALVYGVLGLVVVLGLSKTFGAINATPWFNGIIAVIFIVLSLAMFDVFLIDFTRFQTKLGVKRKEGGSYIVAFLMGSISALLAGACVAPVIISVIVYAQDQYARGISYALALPFLLGAGMALPWPLAGAGLSFLPKPGKWMVRVKYAIGVFILVMGLYYGHLAYRGIVHVDSHVDGEGWIVSLEQGIEQARREHKPVFIDFWATWCKNCLTMDKTTFKDPAVVERLDAYVKVKFQAEDPSDPATAQVLERYGVVGLPTYVILTPTAKTTKQPA